MQQQPKTKVIGGHTYQVGVLPGRSGFAAYLELAKMLGPSLGSVLGRVKLDPKLGTDAQALLAQLLSQELGPIIEAAVTTLAGALDTPKVMEMVDKLAAVTLVDGRALVVDGDFAGEAWLMMQWLAFALEVNFGGFLSSWLARAKLAGDGPEAQAGK